MHCAQNQLHRRRVSAHAVFVYAHSSVGEFPKNKNSLRYNIFVFSQNDDSFTSGFRQHGTTGSDEPNCPIEGIIKEEWVTKTNFENLLPAISNQSCNKQNQTLAMHRTIQRKAVFQQLQTQPASLQRKWFTWTGNLWAQITTQRLVSVHGILWQQWCSGCSSPTQQRRDWPSWPPRAVHGPARGPRGPCNVRECRLWQEGNNPIMVFNYIYKKIKKKYYTSKSTDPSEPHVCMMACTTYLFGER